MKSTVRAIFLIAAVFLPIAAQAEMFKCKQADGKFAYQDSPCATDAKQEVMKIKGANNAPLLVRTFSEAVVVGMRAGARRAESTGKISSKTASCIMDLDSSKFNTVVGNMLAAEMTPADLSVTNIFFDTPAGRKYAKRILLEAYATVNETPPEAAPTYTSTEAKEVADYESSPTAKRVKGGAFMKGPNGRPVTEYMKELMLSCGAKV